MAVFAETGRRRAAEAALVAVAVGLGAAACGSAGGNGTAAPKITASPASLKDMPNSAAVPIGLCAPNQAAKNAAGEVLQSRGDESSIELPGSDVGNNVLDSQHGQPFGIELLDDGGSFVRWAETPPLQQELNNTPKQGSHSFYVSQDTNGRTLPDPIVVTINQTAHTGTLHPASTTINFTCPPPASGDYIHE